jgi:hypothetical protein
MASGATGAWAGALALGFLGADFLAATFMTAFVTAFLTASAEITAGAAAFSSLGLALALGAEALALGAEALALGTDFFTCSLWHEFFQAIWELVFEGLRCSWSRGPICGECKRYRGCGKVLAHRSRRPHQEGSEPKKFQISRGKRNGIGSFTVFLATLRMGEALAILAAFTLGAAAFLGVEVLATWRENRGGKR